MLVAAVIAAIYLYQSHDLKCDVEKRIERQEAGKGYWCWGGLE